MSQAEYNVWLDKGHFEDAERVYQEHLAQLRAGGCPSSAAGTPASTVAPGKSPLACEIARAREHIQKSLGGCSGSSGVNAQPGSGGGCKLGARVDALEKENKQFKTLIDDLTETVARLTGRVFQLEYQTGILKRPEISNCPPIQPPTVTKKEEEAEDDFELFGSDDEEVGPKEVDAEADRIKQQRVEAYEAKKAKKPVLVAKSNIILDVKPWDDETDMAKLEECVRTIEMDGLLWGASKLVPLAYGIKKLQISCVVEDDKVSTDDLEEKILAFEDYIQSMDIAAFNKI